MSLHSATHSQWCMLLLDWSLNQPPFLDLSHGYIIQYSVLAARKVGTQEVQWYIVFADAATQ